MCDYVLSGHRLKVVIPSQSLAFAFSPSGVRTPQKGMPASGGKPAVKVGWFVPAHHGGCLGLTGGEVKRVVLRAASASVAMARFKAHTAGVCGGIFWLAVCIHGA